MNEEEFEAFGDIVIEDTGYGFKVIPESEVGKESACGSCSGCE